MKVTEEKIRYCIRKRVERNMDKFISDFWVSVSNKIDYEIQGIIPQEKEK